MKAKCLGPLQIIMWPCQWRLPKRAMGEMQGSGAPESALPHDDAEV